MMSRHGTLSAAQTIDNSKPRERRKVVATSVIGITIEWCGFFIYAFAANLVLAKVFLNRRDLPRLLRPNEDTLPTSCVSQ